MCVARLSAYVVVLMAGAAWFPALAQDESPNTQPPSDNLQQEVYVFGRSENRIGTALAASEGVVGGADLLVRPLLKVAELLEAVPGMIAAQHSGSGKANQYFLRGFNLDHGSDFTTYIDDVQMNLRSHGHGHGYLDLNGLIPEIIEREEYRKGPYRADTGDFALAGAAYMMTIDRYDESWVAAEAGSYGWRRVAAGGTLDVDGADLTLVGQWKTFDGPWQLGEDLKHYASFAKYGRLTPYGFFDFTLHGYYGRWLPTEQIPERAIGTPSCADVFCAIDPTAVGESTRFVASARLTNDDWHGNIYTQYYDWSMYSNPVYFNPNGASAQIFQFDHRWIYGLKAQKEFVFSPNLQLLLGTENRYDDISSVGVDDTTARAFVASFGDFAVEEASASLFAETTWSPIEDWRITGGLRGDYYDFNVSANNAVAYGGNDEDTMLSAKLGTAYTISDNLEFYANWGQGFHSNDARGVANPTNPVPGLVRGSGYETGTRLQWGTLSFTATYWWLNLDSELKFVGDSNSIEPSGASRRHGIEFVAFWRPFDWLAIDGNYTISHARFTNAPGAEYVPGAFENAGQLGASIILDEWEGSIRWRHLGPYPLIEDNSQRDSGSDIVNARGAWKFDHWEIYADLGNVFDSKAKDIAYYYGAYIPAIDGPFQSPAWDENGGPLSRLSRVVEPRTLRVGLKYRF